MNRNFIINESNKSYFRDFVEKNDVLDLLNDEGLNLLSNCKIKEDRINYILAFSNSVNELFKNDSFLNIFINSDISYYYANLKKINYLSACLIIEKATQFNKSNNFISDLISYFDEYVQINILKNIKLNNEIISRLIDYGNVGIINYILNDLKIDICNLDINYLTFFEKAKVSSLKKYEHMNLYDEVIDEIKIPNYMLSNHLAKKLFQNNDIFKLRRIINDGSYISNFDIINNYVKKEEENIINNCNDDSLIPEFQKLFIAFKKMIECEEQDKYDDYLKNKKIYYQLMDKLGCYSLIADISNKYYEGGLVGVYNYLKKLSDNNLSNYIIDYHFEENFHNIMIDLNELLNFYYNGDIILDEERLHLYQQIFNIDYLSVEEKKELHNNMKNKNMMEIFYDDMLLARKIVRNAIKDASLTREDLIKYKDIQLSDQYGVDVYKLGDEPFFGIVKSGKHEKDDLPVGHSYSLVGSGYVSTFGDENNYLYDSSNLNPDQIVHVFPYDSFTLYKPFNCVKEATKRVNPLMMPDEIVSHSDYSYTEILILEEGKKNIEYNRNIPMLKQIAVFCIDKIIEKDVRNAQINGIGIVLVNSKGFKINESKNSIYRHNFDNYDYNYYNEYYENYEVRR